jgi:hypothetical protein
MKAALLVFSLATVAVSPQSIQSSYSTDDAELRLQVSWEEASSSMGQVLEVRYSVHRDQPPLQGRPGAGRFVSCVNRQPTIEPLLFEGDPIGWMITGWGICGNTWSHIIELVLPRDPQDGGPGYSSASFLSKDVPQIVTSSGGLEIWYYEQNWGGGGTSTSFFMPRKLRVDLEGGVSVVRGNVRTNVDFLENNPVSDWLRPGFLGLFAAGLEDANPELMQYALDHHYSERQEELYSEHFRSGKKEYLSSLVARIEQVRDLHQEIAPVVSWPLGP